MTSKNQNPPFVMVPRKFLKIDISPVAFRVFIVLRSFGDKNGRSIRPSWERLSECSQAGRTTVYRALVELRSLKIIKWRTGGRNRANDYEILPESEWLNRVPNRNSKKEPIEFQKTSNRVPNTNSLGSAHGTPRVPPVEHHLDPVNKMYGPRFTNNSARATENWIQEPGIVDLDARRAMLRKQAKDLGE